MPIPIKVINGGEFLIRDLSKDDIFVPEEFSIEQNLLKETVERFINEEVIKDIEKIDNANGDFSVLKKCLKKASDLGLFALGVPSEYGGLELDLTSFALAAEKTAKAGSFSVSLAAHIGIGMLPLVYYGTKNQKEKYLPKLMSGDFISAYCLTEPLSGSDALSLKASIKLSGDNKYYILNGTKQFITNANISGLYTVFAKTENGDFAALLVERGFSGVSVGGEEDKMGIKGSSTAQVIFDDVKVPVENLLGKAGEGHKIAFSVLDEGRLILASACVGAAKESLKDAIKYANQRKQFNTEISKFGAIKEKVAEMSAMIFASESLVYRLSGLYDAKVLSFNIEKGSPGYYEKYRKALEDYAIECSISKVFSSEMLDFVADNALQIYGGYGFIKGYSCERFYRDSRINRIFEGTNEINRYLIPGMLLKKVKKGELPMGPEIKKAAGFLLSSIFEYEYDESLRFSDEKTLIKNFKTMFLITIGKIFEEYIDKLDKLKDEEEILFALSDVIIGIFAVESLVLRADKIYDNSTGLKQKLLDSIVKIAAFELNEKVSLSFKKALLYSFSGDDLNIMLSSLRRFTKYIASDLLASKRFIAEKTAEIENYVF